MLNFLKRGSGKGGESPGCSEGFREEEPKHLPFPLFTADAIFFTWNVSVPSKTSEQIRRTPIPLVSILSLEQAHNGKRSGDSDGPCSPPPLNEFCLPIESAILIELLQNGKEKNPHSANVSKVSPQLFCFLNGKYL